MSTEIMRRAMKAKTSSPEEKTVLLALALHADDDGVFYMSASFVQQIADECEFTRQKTVRIMRRLKLKEVRS